MVPPDLLEEVFELNMQLEELRGQKKMGEDDPALIEEIGRQKLELEEKHESAARRTEGLLEARGIGGGRAALRRMRLKVRDQMVDLLNRRNYIRNLVRDVNEVLES